MQMIAIGIQGPFTTARLFPEGPLQDRQGTQQQGTTTEPTPAHRKPPLGGQGACGGGFHGGRRKMERGDKCGPAAPHPALAAHWALLSPAVATLFLASLSHYKKAPGKEGSVAPQRTECWLPQWGSAGRSCRKEDLGGCRVASLDEDRQETMVVLTHSASRLKQEDRPGRTLLGTGGVGRRPVSCLCHIGLLCTRPASKHVTMSERGTKI